MKEDLFLVTYEISGYSRPITVRVIAKDKDEARRITENKLFDRKSDGKIKDYIITCVQTYEERHP